MMIVSQQEIVIRNQEIAPGAFILSFPRGFEFEAGQVIGISLDKHLEPRLYSIASGNRSETVDILYTVNPDGLLTPGLSRLRKGDRLFRTDPFGKFICTNEQALWVATGTGIAPFAAMLFSGLGHGKTLIFGNRTHKELYFQDQFRRLLKNGHYIPCTSREEYAEAFFGRVTDFIRSNPGLCSGLPCYLCGSAEMVVDVRDILIELGVPFDKIYAEIFF
jgi:ferredoxin/flavodoxin---NADP+ reductase